MANFINSRTDVMSKNMVKVLIKNIDKPMTNSLASGSQGFFAQQIENYKLELGNLNSK